MDSVSAEEMTDGKEVLEIEEEKVYRPAVVVFVRFCIFFVIAFFMKVQLCVLYNPQCFAETKIPIDYLF